MDTVPDRISASHHDTDVRWKGDVPGRAPYNVSDRCQTRRDDGACDAETNADTDAESDAESNTESDIEAYKKSTTISTQLISYKSIAAAAAAAKRIPHETTSACWHDDITTNDCKPCTHDDNCTSAASDPTATIGSTSHGWDFWSNILFHDNRHCMQHARVWDAL